MTVIDEVIAFYRARLDEDERIAQAAADPGGPNWPDADGEMWTNVLVHARRHDPARVLREVEAGRRIIERYTHAAAIPESLSSFVRGQDDGYRQAYLYAIKDAVAVYADNPDYDESWRP